jgi:hypothetical protein
MLVNSSGAWESHWPGDVAGAMDYYRSVDVVAGSADLANLMQNVGADAVTCPIL